MEKLIFFMKNYNVDNHLGIKEYDVPIKEERSKRL